MLFWSSGKHIEPMIRWKYSCGKAIFFALIYRTICQGAKLSMESHSHLSIVVSLPYIFSGKKFYNLRSLFSRNPFQFFLFVRRLLWDFFFIFLHLIIFLFFAYILNIIHYTYKLSKKKFFQFHSSASKYILSTKLNGSILLYIYQITCSCLWNSMYMCQFWK